MSNKKGKGSSNNDLAKQVLDVQGVLEQEKKVTTAVRFGSMHTVVKPFLPSPPQLSCS